ncbi:MAG: ice-binding family protein [Gallionella sp.]
MKNFEKFYKPAMWSTTVLLATILAACGGSSGSGSASATPTPAATGATCTAGTLNCVDLKTAANYAILAEAGVTYTPTATTTSTPKIIGNIGISPAQASFITGFALNLPAGGAYSTSTLVTGAIYAPGYANPTPNDLTVAIGDKLAAYNAAVALASSGGGVAGGTPGVACPNVGDLGAQTLTPGVYKCGATALQITTGTLTLSGAGVYVIQTNGTLTQAANTQVTLTGGALPQDVFWQVAGAVSIGAGAHMEGNILSASNIAMVTGATLKGRLYAKTGVAMDANTVTQP